MFNCALPVCIIKILGKVSLHDICARKQRSVAHEKINRALVFGVIKSCCFVGYKYVPKLVMVNLRTLAVKPALSNINSSGAPTSVTLVGHTSPRQIST